MTNTIGQGMVLAGTGLDFRRHDYIDREAVERLAHIVVGELQPCYGYCTGIHGWNGAWAEALITAKVPYCAVLPYRSMGTNWFRGDRDKLSILTHNAEEVVYISDRYYQDVYADRAKYLVEHVEGVVALDRLLIEESRVVTLARGLGLPVLNLWHRYNHLLLD